MPLLPPPILIALIFHCAHVLSFSHNHIPTTRRAARNRLFAEAERRREENCNRLLIFGLGNVGTLVAERSLQLKSNDSGAPFFECVYGTTRSGKAINCIQSVSFDDCKTLEDILPSCTHILVTIPPIDPSTITGNTTNATFVDPVLNHPNLSLLESLPADAWVGYVSSTSVYGNHEGEWVDETSEVRCKPGSKGELYFRAENEWRKAAKRGGWRMRIFRASGLYGDDRSAIHTIRKRGVPPDLSKVDGSKESASNKDFPTSRIHEEDVSRAILSAMMRNESSDESYCLWNLADDEPAPRSEVMAFGAQLLGESGVLPSKEKNSVMPQRSERDRRRRTDRKRVSNRRMKEDLLPNGRLLFSTYREGLQSILDSNKGRWSNE